MALAGVARAQGCCMVRAPAVISWANAILGAIVAAILGNRTAALDMSASDKPHERAERRVTGNTDVELQTGCQNG